MLCIHNNVGEYDNENIDNNNLMVACVGIITDARKNLSELMSPHSYIAVTSFSYQTILKNCGSF